MTPHRDDPVGELVDRLRLRVGDWSPESVTEFFRTATVGERAIFACFEYQAQVNNGGHSQFFWNSTGDFWPEVRSGLESLNASNHLKILDRALSVFDGARPSTDRAIREQQVRALDDNAEAFEDVDASYFELDAVSCLDDLMACYLLDHPEQFASR